MFLFCSVFCVAIFVLFVVIVCLVFKVACLSGLSIVLIVPSVYGSKWDIFFCYPVFSSISISTKTYIEREPILQTLNYCVVSKWFNDIQLNLKVCYQIYLTIYMYFYVMFCLKKTSPSKPITH